MMRTWSIYAPLFVAIAATAAAFTLYRENAALRRELAVQVAPSGEPMAAPASVPLPASEIAEVASAEPTVERGLAREPAPATGATPRDARPGPDRRDRGQEFMARALADPESRAAMLSRFKTQIDRTFGDYFVKQGLDETRIEMLRTLLAERQMVRMESGMLERSADDELTRAEAQAWRDAKLATTESDINSILGADGLKSLQAYQDSAPQRNVIADIARRASYAGAPLTDAANEQLLDVIRSSTAEVPLPELGRRDSTAGVAAPAMTPQAVDGYLQQMRAQNQAIIEQAKSFLTQPQLEALADQQIDAMQQAEARLKFILRNPEARGGPGGFRGGGRGPGG